MTYSLESLADYLLVGITVFRGLTLLLAKNLSGVLNILIEIIEALFNVFSVKALLPGFQAALFHSSDIFGDYLDDHFEVIDQLL